MLKGMKQSNKQMKRAKQAECLEIGDLFEEDIPVWYELDGQVSSEWLSICEEERHQTIGLMEQITCFTNLQRAYKSVKSNGGEQRHRRHEYQVIWGMVQRQLRDITNDPTEWQLCTPSGKRGKNPESTRGLPTIRHPDSTRPRCTASDKPSVASVLRPEIFRAKLRVSPQTEYAPSLSVSAEDS